MRDNLAKDWSDAPKEYETQPDILARLDACRFDINRTPAPSIPLFYLGDTVIATAGNLMVVQAQSKAGKSAVVCALLAATMEGEGDCLGFRSSNPDNGAVIHFDTEQSEEHHYAGLLRALKRAGRSVPPEWLHSYHITAETEDGRRAMLLAEMQRRKDQHGSVRAVILDGVADLIIDPNDPVIAPGFVGELHRYADQFQTVIVGVIHENPSGIETGKTRGHLGTALERKAETNLRLLKGSDGVTVMYSERSRTLHLPKHAGQRFAWCDVAGMHVSVADGCDTRAAEKRESYKELLEDVFRDSELGGMRRCDIMEQLKKEASLSDGGARTRFDQLRNMGLLVRAQGGNWRKSL